ncbi:MAG: septum site-determining protein MinC [Bacillota bacterium]
MEESTVSFKATLNGLVLIMREEDDFDTVYDQVAKKLETSGRFFKGASLSIKYRGKKLEPWQEQKISALISEKADAVIESFEEDTSAPVIEKEETSKHWEKPKIKLVYFNGLEEGMTKFHRGTVRSGQLVNFDGNLVIIGDVNPGGEIVATGNVVVMGSLRGMVHAGADGNRDAIVAALSLQPTQLRIADVISRPPDAANEKEARQSLVPEMAFVKDGLVYIERLLEK